MSNAQAPGWVSNRYPRVTAWVRLGDIAEINPQSLGEATPPNFEFEYIDLGSVDEGRIALPLQRTRFECAPSRARRLVRRGDVLIATVRPLLGGHARLQSVGASPTVASTGFAAIRAKNDEGAGLVWHCLRTNLVRRQFHAKVTGSSYPAVNEADIGELWLPKPSTAALRKVLAAADALDLAIEKTDALIAAKREQKRGLMQQLLTGKVRFPGFTDPWKTVRLGEVVSVDPEQLPSTTPADYLFNYIDLSSVNNGRIELPTSTTQFSSAPSRARRVLKTGDVLLSTVRPLLKGFGILTSDAGPFVGSTGFAVLRGKRQEDARFVFECLFSSPVLRQMHARTTGSSYPALGADDVRDLRIPWPSISERDKIEALLTATTRELRLLEDSRSFLANERRGLMERLLSGDITIPSSDTSAA